ncbi:MAG: DMT family transporter [Bacteroidales bacterium]|nr:DMT family transporter [Bacteroidales bacterium]MCF8388089.1 DMT family transporter [Bacteroidales bacterium]
MKQQNRAYLLALTAILFWSTMSSAFKITLRYIDPLNLLLFASFFSSIVLFALLLVNGKIHLLRQANWRDIRNSAILGLLNPFLYYLVLFRAYELLPAQEAGTLNYIWPVVLVLLSIPILKQKINWLSILAILISFLGIIIISTHGDILSFEFTNTFGVILAVGSAVFWALFFILNMKDQRAENIKIFLNISFGFVYVLILVLLFFEIKLPESYGLLGVAYIGAFEMGITFVIWLTALRLSSNTARISNLVYLSPFIALVFIRYAVGEVILLSTVVGLFFVVCGIILQKYSKYS